MRRGVGITFRRRITERRMPHAIEIFDDPHPRISLSPGRAQSRSNESKRPLKFVAALFVEFASVEQRPQRFLDITSCLRKHGSDLLDSRRRRGVGDEMTAELGRNVLRRGRMNGDYFQDAIEILAGDPFHFVFFGLGFGRGRQRMAQDLFRPKIMQVRFELNLADRVIRFLNRRTDRPAACFDTAANMQPGMRRLSPE